MEHNIPIKHHTIPASYLRGFLKPDEKLLWVYDKISGATFQKSPETTSTEKNFNSYINKHGDIDTTFERKLSDIEATGANIIKKIISKTPLSQTEKQSFSSYLELTLRRTKGQKDKTLKRIDKHFEDYLPPAHLENEFHNGLKLKMEGRYKYSIAEEFRNKVLKGKFPGDNDKQIIWLGATYKHSSGKIKEAISKMDWTFFQAPNAKLFITCDQPFTFNVKLDEIPATFVFPISRQFALMGSHYGRSGYFDSNEQRLCAFNKRIFHSAYRFVFSSERIDPNLFI